MSSSENELQDNIDDSSKLKKLIIISKRGKSDNRCNDQIISVKNEEGRMELRMDNISENITKNKIDKTLQSIIYSKSISSLKQKKREYFISNRSNNTLSERERIKSDNKKKYDFYLENKPKIIDEKNIINSNVKAKDNIYNKDNNNELTKYYNNINNNTNIDENSVKDNIIIINDKENKKDTIEINEINNTEIKENNISNQNVVKNIEKLIDNSSNISTHKKGYSTEPNNIANNNRNKLRELLKRDNITNDEDDEDDDIEECEEEIISNNDYHNVNNNNNNNNMNKNNNKLSSIRDFDSNIAKHDQSEKDNRYLISSCNDGLNIYNNFFKNNINNSVNNNIEKIINSNIYSNNIKKDNEEKNNNLNEDIHKNIQNHISNKTSSKELKEKYSNDIISRNSKPHNQNSIENSKESKNKPTYSTFLRKRVFIPVQYNIPNNITCSICDNNWPNSKIFVGECCTHFICKRCAKNYYEEQIENGETELHCPFLFCRANFPKGILKNFVSEEHLNLLEKNNKNKLLSSKIKTNTSYEQMKLYSKKNVIDINNNKILYNYNKSKDIFCSNCQKDTLFSKVNNYFLKCLNCGHCECKYCFKDYTLDHLNRNSNNRCKVFYRRNDENVEINKCIFFLLQIFLVFAMYCMIFISIFLNLKEFFKYIFGIRKKNNNYICLIYYFKMFFVIIFSTFFLILCIPFIIIWYSFFPYILALFDY